MRRLFIVHLLLVVLLFVNSASSLDCDGDSQQEGCDSTTKADNDTTTTTQSEEMTVTTPQSTSSEVTIPFRPTPLTQTTVSSGNSSKEAKGRALNFTVDNSNNNLSYNLTHHDPLGDLSDVTINEDDEDDMEDIDTKLKGFNATLGICEKGGLTYENGEKLEIDCDTICTCTNGKMDCSDRCAKPFIRRGKKIDDPLCITKPAEDPCCNVLICSADTETEPLEMCTYKNKTYNRGDTFNKGCDEVCICDAGGKQSCKPRCPPTNKTSDRCVEVPHPSDPCCKKVLCDVTLDDHEAEKENESLKIKLTAAKYVNSTTIQLNFGSHIELNDSDHLIDVSDDQMSWKTYHISKDGYVTVRDPGRFAKLENSDNIIMVQNTELAYKHRQSENSADTDDEGCKYKGNKYKFGEEFNDECISHCVCKESGVDCLKIECPTYFGVDVLDPQCVEWETVPPNFTPKAPNCCPEKLRCKSNGSCEYEGKAYANWQPIPENITGCENKCYCEMGKVECQNRCPPVTAVPPRELHCPSNEVTIGHIPEDDCCMHWVCASENEPKRKNVTRDKMEQLSGNMTHEIRLEQFTEKPPSKIFGPLLVYTNKDEEPTEVSSKVPMILPGENPFFHNPQDSTKSKPNHSKSSNNNQKDKKPEVLVTSKPQKELKHKNNFLFITPPPKDDKIHTTDVSEQNVPMMIPTLPLPKPEGPHVHIHGKGTPPHEILQFINQHPEITNYPSGSVLEIHNIPQAPKPPTHGFINPGLPHLPPNVIPYVVPQQTDELPDGLSLEQFLQELHKNVHQQQANPIPFDANQFNNNNGLIIAQSGPVIPPRPNSPNQGQGGHIFPGHFPMHPQQGDIVVHTLEAIDAHRIKLIFVVPPIIVGLHGRVEVRYTSKQSEDTSTWDQQVFAPPNDLISTPQMEFDLNGLNADTEYKIQITITLRDAHNTPTSKIYKIKTPKEIVTTTAPPVIPIEPELAITDINATWVTVMWRKFTDQELQYIDGVQLRFKEIDGKIYAATPLIHRAVTSYTLEKLKPNTKYEIGIYFIPFPGQYTELHAEHMLHFTTANKIDTYGFNVTLEISLIKSTSVEIVWSGVPYPEDKYVSIYRAIYQSDSGKEDQSTFKMAKRDSLTKTIIMDLKPGTRYRLWLEVYLTNGKVKTSNVQEFMTRPRPAPTLGASTQQDKLSRQHIENSGNYYGPLVIVAILASIAILSTLVLLLILVRRHNQNKAPITPPSRVSQSAYDNPTYKVEIQQETMGL